jgi:hypothetical protein
MSHPDPLHDPDNSYENDDMSIYDPSDALLAEYLYKDRQAEYDDFYDDSMDGDHESGLASAGWGTDEDYGYFGGEDY